MSHPVDTTVDLNQFEWFDSSAPLHLHSVREGGVVKFFFVCASATNRILFVPLPERRVVCGTHTQATRQGLSRKPQHVSTSSVYGTRDSLVPRPGRWALEARR